MDRFPSCSARSRVCLSEECTAIFRRRGRMSREAVSHPSSIADAPAPRVNPIMPRPTRPASWNRICRIGRVCLGESSGGSHLLRRDELQRPQGDLEVGGVGLEVVQGLGNVLLQLRRRLPRRAGRGDLVQRRVAHFRGWWNEQRESRCCGSGDEDFEWADGVFVPSALCGGPCAFSQ